MKKIIIILSFCMLGVSLTAQELLTENVLSLKDAIALYEGEEEIETIKELVSKEINTADDGNTPLSVASMYGYIEIVKSLIADDADIDAKNNAGWTALMEASKEGHTETVKALIDAGADIDLKNDGGLTALIMSSMSGYTETVKVLIDAGADIDAQAHFGLTALMLASEFGCTDVVKILIEAGADIDARGSFGNTALMRVANYRYTAEMIKGLIEINMEGQTEIVKILIEAGADIDVKNQFSRTALIVAAEGGATEIANLLKAAGGGEIIVELIEELISKDINATDTNYNNYTPLHYASMYGYLEIVKSLIADGAKVNAKNSNGETALIVAASKGQTEIVKLLIEAGAKVNVKNQFSRTALIIATENDHTEIVNLLKAAGAESFYNFNKFLIIGVLFVWSLCGAVVFWLYYLLFKRTIKKKGSVQSTSFVVRAPLIIGGFNLLCIALTVFMYGFGKYFKQYIDYLFLPIVYYFILAAIPISIGSIAIFLWEYKRKIVTGKRLRIIVLMNTISIIFILFLIIKVLL